MSHAPRTITLNVQVVCVTVASAVTMILFWETGMTPNQEKMIRISKEIDFANGFIDPSYFEKLKEEYN